MNTFPAKLISLLLFSAMACSPEKEAATSITLAAPGDLTVEQVSSESVRLSWKDTAADEEGYYVFSGANVRPVATLPSDSESYVVEGLPMGSTCYFGVRAFGKDHSLSPLVSTDRIRILSADERRHNRANGFAFQQVNKNRGSVAAQRNIRKAYLNHHSAV